ncbi:4-hydroxyphenylacetate 3-monooxygenase, oxygenase component (plasmid) [Bacillus sp. 31A1R]|uniref:4-hydroxyphenylacetate 3-monooxygenase, oxygenase component n=1 Tax=Robertmurraya mangrovi TaxID=3098077 RepID=A0ABU5IV69_9BACI|nr:4-hydroxyphenylacetate 3-monooxygenase, oxygenase component [Bacillus sp. 31A1R]MDZ5471042.1 4-hydroxyphenylacetate 3-monooxygenase, oxygenase component [Bacillus sp. 31A1R]
MPAISGEEYIKRVDQLHSEIWLDGTKVTGELSKHKAFSGVIQTQSQLYDLQLDQSIIDKMTFPSPSSGDKVGVSFLEPRTIEDLALRRFMIQTWAKASGGMLGRSPDYMNTALMSIASSADILSKQDASFTKNLERYFEFVRENDLCMTHTFINPQVNRSKIYYENDKEIIVAQPIKKTSEGFIIKGARLLATQGGITDEILVLPSQAASYNDDLAYGFAIPSNTPGLKFICRESFAYDHSKFNHPLGSQFEEMDAIVVFDDVLVPWERVFFYNHPEIAYNIYSESSFFPLITHHVLCRRVVKTEFILGIAQLLVETINVSEYQHVQEKISEIIVGLETLKSLLLTSELNARSNKWNIMIPEENAVKVAATIFPRIYPRFMEIFQQIGASGLASIPTEGDFSSEIKPDLQLYLQAAGANAEEKVKLFRLAWDASMSAFGTRQTLYERFFFGDPIRLSSGLYQSYDLSSSTSFVKDFLARDK